MFQHVVERIQSIDQSLGNRLNHQPQQIENDLFTNMNNDLKVVMKCNKCGNDMILRTKKDGNGKFLSCNTYPQCKNSVWFPNLVENVEVLEETCNSCGPNSKLVKIKFRQNPFIGEPNPNSFCLAGCDEDILQVLDVNSSSANRTVMNTSNRPANSNSNVPSITNTSNRPVNTSSNNRTGINTSNRPAVNTTLVPQVVRNAGNAPNNTQEIVCICNNAAKQLTVRKDGPNKGRKFYKCATDACNFFTWAPDDELSLNSTNNMPPPPPPPPAAAQVMNNDADEPNCNCNLAAVKRQVTKTGPNTGRYFYSCSKGPQQGCNFFKWCDSDGNDSFKGGKSNKRPASSSTQPRAKRKCSNCKEEGHTRNKCPRL